MPFIITVTVSTTPAERKTCLGLMEKKFVGHNFRCIVFSPLFWDVMVIFDFYDSIAMSEQAEQSNRASSRRHFKIGGRTYVCVCSMCLK